MLILWVKLWLMPILVLLIGICNIYRTWDCMHIVISYTCRQRFSMYLWKKSTVYVDRCYYFYFHTVLQGKWKWKHTESEAVWFVIHDIVNWSSTPLPTAITIVRVGTELLNFPTNDCPRGVLENSSMAGGLSQGRRCITAPTSSIPVASQSRERQSSLFWHWTKAILAIMLSRPSQDSGVPAPIHTCRERVSVWVTKMQGRRLSWSES